MGRFGADPLLFFDRVYSDTAPWEVGGAQPDMARLLEEDPPHGLVVDLGSATGDLAIHLALAGHRVVGVEFVESAVAQAREKAAALPLRSRNGCRSRLPTQRARRPWASGLVLSSTRDSFTCSTRTSRMPSSRTWQGHSARAAATTCTSSRSSSRSTMFPGL